MAGGRPEVRKNIAAIARQHGEKAISKLASFLDDSDPDIVLRAAKEILDRGYGKPTQPLAGDDEAGPVRMQVSWLD